MPPQERQNCKFCNTETPPRRRAVPKSFSLLCPPQTSFLERGNIFSDSPFSCPEDSASDPFRDIGFNVPNLEVLEIARGVALEGPKSPGPAQAGGAGPPPPLPPPPLPRLRVLRVAWLDSCGEGNHEAARRGDLHRVAPNLEELYVETITSKFHPGPLLRGLRRLRLLEMGDESSVEGCWMAVAQPSARDKTHLRLPLGRDGAIEGAPTAPGVEAAAPAEEGAGEAAGAAAGGLELRLKWDIDGNARPRLTAGGPDAPEDCSLLML
jgi:hypothetical protein